MNQQDVLKIFVEKTNHNLLKNKKVINSLISFGIKESFIFENFKLGFVDNNVYENIGTEKVLLEKLKEIGLFKKNLSLFNNLFTLPIYEENKTIVNIIFFDSAKPEKNIMSLNEKGIFNSSFLKNNSSIILMKSCIETLLLIQANYHNATFIFGDNKKYLDFFINNNIRKTIITFEGKATLLYLLENNNISVSKVSIDFQSFLNDDNTIEYLNNLLNIDEENNNSTNNIIEIENGFIFKFPHIIYRVIGNFYEYAMSLKVNIKAIRDQEVFINSIDLYKNRERQNFIMNLMDKFNFKDHIQLENELSKIIEVIEDHKEQKQKENQEEKKILAETQKEVGLTFLNNPLILSEIENDITALGYVNERKNKVLTYLVMCSRLMNDPLHAVVVARSSAGKSRLIDIIESLCPKHDLKSISDLTSQALYYMQENELKNKFVVIGEKEGSKGSEYPLRELISKKSITKSVPIKDPVTGLIKTITVKVNGPISLVETTSSGEINIENLNRCFIISVDESEEQTKFIQENQRFSDTLEGHLLKQQKNKIIEKHHSAQMLLKNITVINPFAPFITFPTQSIQTRRDHMKFLKLIKVICFLHQYQRQIKYHKLNNSDTLEFIECTLDDYKTAYELLIDGVLDNSFDDLQKPVRELLEIIKSYLKKKSIKENVPVDKIIFTRKDIRDYSNWTFAQIRNNFQFLKEYEYLQTIQSKNGLAHSYRLVGNYSDSSLSNSILTPDELEEKINNANNLTDLTSPVCSA